VDESDRLLGRWRRIREEAHAAESELSLAADEIHERRRPNVGVEAI
jgi:hypothetical protein